MLLTLAIVIQINTIKKTITVNDPTFAENELRDEVLKWKEKYDNCFSSLEKAEKKLEEVRDSATQDDSNMKQEQEELKIAQTYLGLTEVTGKGITITLRDNQTVTSDSIGITETLSDYMIHDLDILCLINELKNTGAEAIAINDQRIIPTTSIVCIGNVVQINGEKVGAPFVIKAIGLQDSLYDNMNRPGGYIAALRGKVEVDLKRNNNLTIPKYNGVINFKYVKEQK